MSAAYAENDDFESYVEGWTTTDPTALGRLLERASDDIDSILGDYDLNESGDWAGRKLDVDTLTYTESRALVRATCAQAEYRDQMGEEFFVRAQYDSVSGPEFTTTGTLPRIGPKVMIELSGTGLLRNMIGVGDRHRQAPPWADFAWNLEDD